MGATSPAATNPKRPAPVPRIKTGSLPTTSEGNRQPEMNTEKQAPTLTSQRGRSLPLEKHSGRSSTSKRASTPSRTCQALPSTRSAGCSGCETGTPRQSCQKLCVANSDGKIAWQLWCSRLFGGEAAQGLNTRFGEAVERLRLSDFQRKKPSCATSLCSIPAWYAVVYGGDGHA